VTDPTAPEILARLGTLPLREQLVTLHAIMIAIPALQRSYPLKARMAAIRSVPAPDRNGARRHSEGRRAAQRATEGRTGRLSRR